MQETNKVNLLRRINGGGYKQCRYNITKCTRIGRLCREASQNKATMLGVATVIVRGLEVWYKQRSHTEFDKLCRAVS